MINELIELVKSWPMLAQVFSVVVLSGMFTLVILALISLASDFINGTLVVLVRGYNPYAPPTESDIEETEEHSDAEKKR